MKRVTQRYSSGKLIEVVEDSGVGGRRERRDRAGRDVVVAEHGDVAGRERHVREDAVEVHRHGWADGRGDGSSRSVECR